MLTYQPWRGFQYLQNSSKVLLCVSVNGATGLCPKAALDCFSLVSHPLPSLTNNCLNLPIGTQERSWRLNGGYFLQLKKWGYRKSLCSGASHGLLRISSHLSPRKSLTWSSRPCMIWSHHPFNLISYYCALLTPPQPPWPPFNSLTCGHIPTPGSLLQPFYCLECPPRQIFQFPHLLQSHP